ncbi:MAG TPA: hypothetical protein VHC90_21070 [Bryobacteraceae bacterium]|nr:hypothetical protein [Bryobacteraceae bacterium]
MLQKIAVTLTSVVAMSAFSMSAAPNGVIGMISAGPGQSGISIDGARVSGNATVFDGSVVSATNYSRMELNSGARVDIGNGSEVRVFSNHVALQRGVSEVQSASAFSIEARNFRITPADANSIARVKLDSDEKVLVTAVSAPVNVWNRYGLLVARVTPAAPMAFLPQAATSTAFNNSGCVVNKSNAPVLVDQTGNQIVELRSTTKGVDFRKFVGKRASVTGNVIPSATPVQGASQAISVSSISAASGGDCSAVAARVGATMSAAGIAAGGAAAGAAAGGAAAAGAAAGAAGAAAGAAAGVSAAAIGGIVGASVLVGATITTVVTASGTSSPSTGH